MQVLQFACPGANFEDEKHGNLQTVTIDSRLDAVRGGRFMYVLEIAASDWATPVQSIRLKNNHSTFVEIYGWTKAMAEEWIPFLATLPKTRFQDVTGNKNALSCHLDECTTKLSCEGFGLSDWTCLVPEIQLDHPQKPKHDREAEFDIHPRHQGQYPFVAVICRSAWDPLFTLLLPNNSKSTTQKVGILFIELLGCDNQSAISK